MPEQGGETLMIHLCLTSSAIGDGVQWRCHSPLCDRLPGQRIICSSLLLLLFLRTYGSRCCKAGTGRSHSLTYKGLVKNARKITLPPLIMYPGLSYNKCDCKSKSKRQKSSPSILPWAFPALPNRTLSTFFKFSLRPSLFTLWLFGYSRCVSDSMFTCQAVAGTHTGKIKTYKSQSKTKGVLIAHMAVKPVKYLGVFKSTHLCHTVSTSSSPLLFKGANDLY